MQRFVRTGYMHRLKYVISFKMT